MIESVRCPGKGKTLAIFISPFAEKVYYFSPSHLEDYKLPDTVETTDE
jgi:hypothetical protein